MIRYFISLIIGVSFTAQAQVDGNMLLSESGVKRPSYVSITNEMNDLAETYPELTELKVYGESVDGRPLTSIEIGLPLEVLEENRKAILITGATHGNEYLNIADRLPRWILEEGLNNSSVREFLDTGGLFIIVPILNPDGFSRGRRHNRNGVDLNRDFAHELISLPGFKEVETRTLSEYLESLVETYGLDLVATMDYHCCVGAIIHPWGHSRDKLEDPMQQVYEMASGKLLLPFPNSYFAGNAWQVVRYLASGTSQDYYFQQYGALSFTFEGAYRVEQRLFKEHTEMIANLVDLFR